MSKNNTINVRIKTNAKKVSVSVQCDAAQTELLKFGKGNAKLRETTSTFSLPAGHSCPFARECLSKADRKTGHIKDGPDTKFRCFAASMESLRKTVRDAGWHNFDLLRDLSFHQMVDILLLSLAKLPKATTHVRIHVRGDFFSQEYFDAWLEVAKTRTDLTFYFYTKSLTYWVARLEEVGDGHTPGTVENFVPTASRGGRLDHLIEEYGLRSAKVIVAPSETKAEAVAAFEGLEIDHDDSHAMKHGADFALLIHGPQPAGSEAAKAIAGLRAEGEYGYGQKADERRGRQRISLV